VRCVWSAPVPGSGVRGHAEEKTGGPKGGGGRTSAVGEKAGGDGVGRGEEEDLDSVVVDARSIFEMLQDQSTQQQAEIAKSYHNQKKSKKFCRLSLVLNWERCGSRSKGFRV
jgi:hypothetical protein